MQTSDCQPGPWTQQLRDVQQGATPGEAPAVCLLASIPDAPPRPGSLHEARRTSPPSGLGLTTRFLSTSTSGLRFCSDLSTVLALLSGGLAPRPSLVTFSLPPALPLSPGSPARWPLPVSAAPAKSPPVPHASCRTPGSACPRSSTFPSRPLVFFPLGTKSSSHSFYTVLRFCKYLSLCHMKPVYSLNRLHFNTLPLESRGIVVTGNRFAP